MPRLLILLGTLALPIGSALAQPPTVWKDPEEGCWYVISPQGGVAVRHRRDGAPDCPDARAASEAPALRTPLYAAPPVATTVAAPPPRSSPAPVRTQPDLSTAPNRVVARSFACEPIDGAAGPPVQRVSIDPRAMVLLVEAADARAERYTIDTTMDAWLGGRNQRDPRLGFVLTQSRGLLRLDWPDGGSLRAPIRAYTFRCQAVGNLT